MIAVVGVLASCGASGSGDRSAGCEEGEAWAGAQAALVAHINGPGDPLEGLDPLIDERDDLEDEMTDAAPADVVDAMTEIRLLGADPSSDAEEERLLDKRLVIEKWLVSDCESDVSVEW